MKTTKAALAAGVFAGLTALPLTTASAATGSSPNGSANAAALTVSLSLAPVRNLVNTAGTTAGGAFSWGTLVGALDTLQSTICGPLSSTSVGCPVNLNVLKDMPDTLKVAVAQANESAVLNAVASDINAGHADSTPVYTNWATLNADLSHLGAAVNSLVGSVTSAMASGNTTLVNALLGSGLSAASNLNLSNVLSVDTSQILGTVQANLNQANIANKAWDTASAVQVTGASQLNGLGVTVDPFTACAASQASFSQCGDGATGAETSAANTLVKATLPALNVTAANLSNLSGLESTLKSLLNAVTNAIANPSQAGNIIASAPVPSSQLSGVLGTIGGLLNTAGGTVSGATGGVTSASPISLDMLKGWDQQLSALVDSLNIVTNQLATINGLPDVANLLTSKDSIATAKTIPTTGGVLSTSTATLGSLSVLPVGDTLSSTLNTVLSKIPAVAGITLNTLNASTPVLELDGITSSSIAGVGTAPACGKNADGSAEFACGSSGLRTVSVLGQTIDLDHSTINGVNPGLPTLGAGQEWHHVFTIPMVGSVTLDIVRGLPQIVSDTPQYREVHTAALDVSLINGNVGCSTTACTDPVGGAPATSAHTNAASPSSSGIAALGSDGSKVVEVGVADTSSSAGFVASGSTTTTPGSQFQGKQTSLPSTGMFGGNALPAGLGLIVVAISLRLVPALRPRLRRVR